MLQAAPGLDRTRQRIRGKYLSQSTGPIRTFTLRKLECFKQAHALNTLAWNNKIGPQFYFVGFRAEVMVDRDSWGSITKGVACTPCSVHHEDQPSS